MRVTILVGPTKLLLDRLLRSEASIIIALIDDDDDVSAPIKSNNSPLISCPSLLCQPFQKPRSERLVTWLIG